MMGGLCYWEVSYDVSNTIVGLISTDLLYLVWSGYFPEQWLVIEPNTIVEVAFP